MQVAADGIKAAAAQREQQLQGQLAAAQEGAAAKLAEQDKHWALRLVATEERSLKVVGPWQLWVGPPALAYTLEPVHTGTCPPPGAARAGAAVG